MVQGAERAAWDSAGVPPKQAVRGMIYVIGCQPIPPPMYRRSVHFPLAMISSRLSAASFDKLINGLVQLLHRCGTAVFYGIYETVFDMIL